MILYGEALAILERAARKRQLTSEVVPLELAVGRVVATEDVRGRECVPPFDNSSMDGFALCSELTLKASKTNPVRFKVLGTIAAGDVFKKLERVSEPVCWEIMTGAALPEAGRIGFFDAVVKIEDVDVKRDPRGLAVAIDVTAPLERLENVRGRGADFREGQIVARSGTLLAPEHLMALASLGIDQVSVVRRPRIALLSTGDEIMPYTRKDLPPGMIRNSTAPYFVAAASRFGAECRYYGVVGDEPEIFLQRLRQMVSDGADVVVTTGAVSMGKHDFIKEALLKAHADILYHKAAIRPGKPGLFAELKGAGPGHGPVFFGIPGNPVSTVVGLRFFIAPYLRALAGLPPERPLRAELEHAVEKPEGLRCFFKARLQLSERGGLIRCLPGQPSFMVGSLLAANAWLVLPENGEVVCKGQVMDAYPIYPLDSDWCGSLASDEPILEAKGVEGCCE